MEGVNTTVGGTWATSPVTHTHTHTHAHGHMYSHAHIDTHSHSHSHSHTDTCTHMHTSTHTHTHTHTHTVMNTETRAPWCLSVSGVVKAGSSMQEWTFISFHDTIASQHKHVKSSLTFGDVQQFTQDTFLQQLLTIVTLEKCMLFYTP